MKLFSYFFVGRQSLSQFWCLQPCLHLRLFNTTPTFNISSKFCTSKQKQENSNVTRNRVTQERLSKRNLTEAVTSEGKSEETVTNQYDGVSRTAKKNVRPGNKLELLAKLLQCNTDELKVLVNKHHFFAHLSPELIKTKINIMLFHGLPYSFISTNPRLLYQTSAEELKRRLQKFRDHSFLSENSVVTLDNLSHYLECRNGQFDWTFKRLCAEKDALEGCYDKTAYLQLRLNVTREQALQLLNSYPLERNISNIKLKEMLDFFLIETNLGATFFIQNRRLLMFSLLRLRTRWKVIVSEGIKSEDKMLHIWNMSEKQFKNMYNNNNDA